MTKKLIALSMIAIPFYEVVLYFFIPGRTYPEFSDMWFTKDFIAMVCSLLIGLYVLSTEGFKPFKEPLLLGFLCFLAINIFKIPSANVVIAGQNFNGMWNHWPVVQCLVFFILFLGIINSVGVETKEVITIASWCGGFMAVYMILQSVGIDQIFNIYPPEIIKGTRQPAVGGTIGQATLSAPFVAMMIPLSLTLGRKTLVILSIIAVIVSGSVFAIGATAVTLFYYFIHRLRILTPAFFVITSIVIMIICGVLLSFGHDFLNDNGRFGIWLQTISTIKNDKIFLSGAGIGAYKYLFAVRNGNLWHQAHNEFLQLFYSVGIIGFTLIFLFIKKTYKQFITLDRRPESTALLFSLFTLLLCAMGTFVFQLAPYQFYAVLFLGLIYKIKREVYHV